jgi:endo-1,3-1,4-beta-glycanase ExoK
MLARQKTRVLVVLLASALTGCGSSQDLVIGGNDFVLERHDDFDQIDASYWELASHTFEPNLAWFSPDNAKVDGGSLVLTISQAQTPAVPAPGVVPKPYAAAEVRTRVAFLYGRFRARARLAPGPGVVSAFWGFYDRYAMSSGEAQDNQIVIEAANTPEPALRYSISVPTGAPKPTQVSPGFDPSADFHEIGFDWTPSEVRFYLDGRVQSAIDGEAARGLTQYQRLVLSAYPTSADWTGELDPALLPVTAAFDWVEIYSYSGARP